MHSILSSKYATITEFKQSPKSVIESAEDNPVAILSHNHPAAYLLSTEMYEEFLKLREEAMLAARMANAKKGKLIEIDLKDFLED